MMNGTLKNGCGDKPNKYFVKKGKRDFLYHFGFGVDTIDIPAIFGDTKFVCTGGSSGRFKLYAEWFAKETNIKCSENLSRSDRFVIYKTGPVCWINHGMGTPSLSIMLIEAFKLMHHAGVKNPTFIRLGTSGGIGVPPGTVVVSSAAMNAEFGDNYVQIIAGKRIERPTQLDSSVREAICKVGIEKNIPVEIGKTMCADDFYEGQMRLDGYFCDYEEEDKYAYLQKLNSLGVRNIEMESTCFASFTFRAGFPSAIVCVTLLNRMDGDQVQIDKDQYIEYEERPFRLVTAYIRQQTGM